MTTCTRCGAQGSASAALGMCRVCLLASEAVRDETDEARRTARRRFGLPEIIPRQGGIRCTECANECTVREGERGFCGLRVARGKRLVHLAGTPSRGTVRWYHDPLPTNCVAAWVCDGSRQRNKDNLAVFYASCTMDCLFCQNWQFRAVAPQDDPVPATRLAEAVTPRTFCVCFFGGDPASQMPHALVASARFASLGLRICWETNATMHPRLFDRALGFSLASGGCVKVDLKAHDEALHTALTGVSNRRVLENFARGASVFRQRPEPPLLVASTLLVPGYVTPEEVARIAAFIASLDPRIPYTLLAFAPHYLMDDLPTTSWSHALEAEEAARGAGLLRVRVANRHLLRDAP